MSDKKEKKEKKAEKPAKKVLHVNDFSPLNKALVALDKIRNQDEWGRWPDSRHIRLVPDGDKATLEATDGRIYARISGLSAVCVEEDETKYPPIEKATPQGEPVVSFIIDARLLRKVLAAASGVDDRVEVSFWSETKPLVLKARNEDEGTEFFGAIVPMRKAP